MDENRVIEGVCSRLLSMGCEIEQRLSTTQRGIDVIARNAHSTEEFIVEAKGGTSSREGSARFGKPYTQNQVFDRVAKGVFTCIQLRANTQIVPGNTSYWLCLRPAGFVLPWSRSWRNLQWLA